MTITFAWWAIPLGFLLAGIIAAVTIGGQKSDYDFFTPLLAAAAFVIGLVGAISFTIAWLLK